VGEALNTLEPSPSKPAGTIFVTVNVSVPLFANVRTWFAEKPTCVGAKRTVFPSPPKISKQLQEMFRIAFLVGAAGFVVDVGAVVVPLHPTSSKEAAMVTTSPTTRA
jgi:hypothetical protein